MDEYQTTYKHLFNNLETIIEGYSVYTELTLNNILFYFLLELIFNKQLFV